MKDLNMPATSSRSAIAFYTLGCRVNQSETAVLQNAVEAEGFRVVSGGEPAGIVVINTCTVTAHGDQDTRRLVNRVNRDHPQARIALIGCQAQTQQDRLARLPNVRWVIGTARKMDLAAILKADPQPRDPAPQVIVPAIPRENFTIPVSGVDRQHTRANLKIQDGCDAFCSFCEIPFARGRARSREFNDTLTEARRLAAAGHREVVLTGINIGHYADAGRTLIDVIQALHGIPQIERLRISSIEPHPVINELAAWMMPQGRLCRFLHIPIQSGSDRILKLMNRRYTRADFTAWIEGLANAVPQICLGTDVIVGFPSETEADFQETYDLLKNLPLHYFHVFSYSQRQQARSQRLPDPVPPPVIQRRSQQLRALSLQKRRAYHQGLIGGTNAVYFEQSKGDRWTGLTDTYVRVSVPSPEDLSGQIRPVRITGLAEPAVNAELI